MCVSDVFLSKIQWFINVPGIHKLFGGRKSAENRVEAQKPENVRRYVAAIPLSHHEPIDHVACINMFMGQNSGFLGTPKWMVTQWLPSGNLTYMTMETSPSLMGKLSINGHFP